MPFGNGGRRHSGSAFHPDAPQQLSEHFNCVTRDKQGMPCIVPKQPNRPKKLQKHRKTARPPHHEVTRRAVSFDFSTLSHDSAKALINAHIAVTRYTDLEHPPRNVRRAVLKKNRDSRALRAQHRPIPSLSACLPGGDCRHRRPRHLPPVAELEDNHPIPPSPLSSSIEEEREEDLNRLHAFVSPFLSASLQTSSEENSLRNHISHWTPSTCAIYSRSPERPYDNISLDPDAESTSTSLTPVVPSSSVPSTNQHRYSLPLLLPPSSLQKPLPPRPSLLVEEFSPQTLHRRWTITSYPTAQGCSSDEILTDDFGFLKGPDPSTPGYVAAALPTPIHAGMDGALVVEQEAAAPSDMGSNIENLVNNFIDTQRSYVETLRTSVSNDHTDSDGVPVALLLALLSVIEVSDELLRKMQSDPTPSGIANAFLTVCVQLEGYLLDWSKEVTSFVDSAKPAEIRVSIRPARHYRQSTVRNWRQPPAKGENTKVSFFASLFKRKTRSAPGVARESTSVIPDSLWQRSALGPGLWEMGVLPTQRTMRCAFFFRELLSLLEASDASYALVDQALHAAASIAQKMARAQQQHSLYFV